MLRWVRQRSGALAAHQAAAVLPDRVDTRNPLHRRRLRELDIDLKTIDPPARACLDVARGALIGLTGCSAAQAFTALTQAAHHHDVPVFAPRRRPHHHSPTKRRHPRTQPGPRHRGDDQLGIAMATAGAQGGVHLLSAEQPQRVLETAVHTLTTAAGQLQGATDLGATPVALGEALNLVATHPDAGTVELDVITNGLTQIAALLEHEGIPEQAWAQPLVDARRAVAQLNTQAAHSVVPETGVTLAP